MPKQIDDLGVVRAIVSFQTDQVILSGQRVSAVRQHGPCCRQHARVRIQPVDRLFGAQHRQPRAAQVSGVDMFVRRQCLDQPKQFLRTAAGSSPSGVIADRAADNASVNACGIFVIYSDSQ
ncbi:hypothetical protein GPU89_10545 [Burkholderia cepacia]|nr:hypothetical protein [Burkholderia cepacia]